MKLNMSIKSGGKITLSLFLQMLDKYLLGHDRLDFGGQNQVETPSSS